MCPPNMFLCVLVSIPLVRILTTPTSRFQQPFRNLFHFKSLSAGVYCRARLGVVFPRDHNYYAVFTNFSLRASVQCPSTSVCISWYGRQLLTIISHLVPSKKQISGVGATSLIDGSSSSNCLTVCLSWSVSFLKFSNDSLPYQQQRDDR